MQGLTFLAITAAEKHTLSCTLECKKKVESLGHMACWKSLPRKITMQGFTLKAITAAENALFKVDLSAIGA